MPTSIRSKTTKKNTASSATLEKNIPTTETPIPMDIPVPKRHDHIHWTIFVAVSLLVASAIIYVGRPDTLDLKASTIPALSPTDQPADTSTPKQQGVLGTVTQITEDSMTLNSVSSTKNSEDTGTVYIIRFNNETQFAYHPTHADTVNPANKIFGSEKGSATDIKIGMYATATTFDTLSPSTPLLATEVGYSESNPLQ